MKLCDSEPVASPQATRPDLKGYYRVDSLNRYFCVAHDCTAPCIKCEIAAQPAAGTTPTLNELLESARKHVMTDEEKEAQRQSWVRGEMALSESERGMTSPFPPKSKGTTPQAERPKCKLHPTYFHIGCHDCMAECAARADASPERICGNCGLPLVQSETEEMCRELDKVSTRLEKARAVAPVETPVELPESELAQIDAEGYANGYTEPAVPTRLTAEQFMRERYKKIFPNWTQANLDKYVKEIKHWLEFAEAYAAGLREEIERLKRELSNADELRTMEMEQIMSWREVAGCPEEYSFTRHLTELRAKLTEQEAKYTTLLNQRYEDMTEFRFRGKTAAELTKILAHYEAAEAELAALRERERWIPVGKRWPAEGEWVNVVIHGVVQHLPAQLICDRWDWYDESADSAPKSVVTHWKALSAAPEPGKEA